MHQSNSIDSIVLCGFMGCGKSTIGCSLAKALSFSFADTDEMIITETGHSIAQIFAECGESGFRDLEHEIIKRAAAEHRCVIATGGGVMTFERNASLLAQRSLIIHIHRSFDDCYEVIRSRQNRPLAGQKSREELFRLYESRLAAYKRYAGYTFINQGTVDEAASRLISWIHSSEQLVP